MKKKERMEKVHKELGFMYSERASYEVEIKEYIEKTITYIKNFYPEMKGFSSKNIRVTLDWSRNLNKCNMAVYDSPYNMELKFRMVYFAACVVNPTFPEYDKYKDDPEIGEFDSDDVSLHILATICHEMAHIVEFKVFDDSTHGKHFQRVYRLLRNKFVNHQLKSSCE